MMYKCLGEGHESPYTGLVWPVETGDWTPARKPVLCRSGWHLSSLAGLAGHLVRGELWEAEGRGEHVSGDDKAAYSQVRLVRQVGKVEKYQLHELACDFAEHVLHLWEVKFPQDLRPRQAIEVSRRFARGEATAEELERSLFAARNALYDDTVCHNGASYAALAATEAASWPTTCAEAACAAVCAVDFTVYSHVVYAACAAERLWQGRRILEVIG